jgi:hypothetical protein
MKSSLLLTMLVAAGLVVTSSNLALADDTSTSGTDSTAATSTPTTDSTGAATDSTSADPGQSSDTGSGDQK